MVTGSILPFGGHRVAGVAETVIAGGVVSTAASTLFVTWVASSGGRSPDATTLSTRFIVSFWAEVVMPLATRKSTICVSWSAIVGSCAIAPGIGAAVVLPSVCACRNAVVLRTRLGVSH